MKKNIVNVFSLLCEIYFLCQIYIHVNFFFILSGMYENDMNVSVTNSGELNFISFIITEPKLQGSSLNLFT